MKKASLQIFAAILVLGLFCGTASAVPTVTGAITPSNSTVVTGTVGTFQTFTVPLNETASVIWTVNGTNITIPTDANNVSTLPNHEFQLGQYRVIVSSTDGVQITDWNVEGTEGTRLITSTSPPEQDPSTGINETKEFSVQTNKVADITWYINGVVVDSAPGVTSDTYQNVSSSAATYNVTVEAKNGTETDSRTWTWTVNSPQVNEVPVEVNPSNDKKVEISQGGSQNFYVNSTNSQNINVEWFVDNATKGNQTGTSALYKFNGDSPGNYTLKAVVTAPSSTYAPSTKTWNITVQSKYYLSGNRIWDEDLGLSTTYTWNAQSYSGFYYDLDTGESSEEIGEK